MSATILDLFETQVLLYPNKVAVSYKNAALTYNELDKKSNAMAQYFVSKGVVHGCIVGIALDRSLELLVSLLAVFKAGAAYVPLDPEYPNQRLEYMLSDSEATILLTNHKYRNELKTVSTVLIIEEIWPHLDNFEKTSSIDIVSEDLAYVLYTSGSTGLPKGVMIEHRNLFNLINSTQKFQDLKVKINFCL